MSLSRAAVIVFAAVALLVAPSTASAIDGWERRLSAGPINDQPFKSATAFCTPGKRVIGGGAAVHDGNRKRVRLVGLVPSAVGFTAVAEAPDHFSSYDWHVTAYVICSDAPELLRSTYQIIRGHVDVSTTGGPFAHTGASCPRGTIAYGAGADVIGNGHNTPSYTGGKIGLQLNRTTGPQDATRASARERPEGTLNSWRLTSYAICAEPSGAMNVRGQVAAGEEARAYCDSGWDVSGPGGGGGLTDGGPVWLRHIVPQASIASVIVRLTGPLNPSIGGMVAHTTCGL